MAHANKVSEQTRTFSKRLKAWRKEIGFFQKEAAEHFEVTLNGYQKWESGKRTPNNLAMCEVERRMKEKRAQLKEAA